VFIVERNIYIFEESSRIKIETYKNEYLPNLASKIPNIYCIPQVQKWMENHG
jgi:hypothetical protein